MSGNTVIVKNISPRTSKKEINDFFSFCGKIASLEIQTIDQSQQATVVFERETAADTALLLDNTQLGASQVKVLSAAGTREVNRDRYEENVDINDKEITQEDKPCSRIVAEYLAHGYVLGDQTLHRAIDLDNKHGLTNRFLSTLKKFDSKYQATDKAKSMDQSYGVTPKVNNILTGLSTYYEKAAGTPSGKKIVNFYTQTSRQVVDIHNEARRLADLKKQNHTTTTDQKKNSSPTPSPTTNTKSTPSESEKHNYA